MEQETVHRVVRAGEADPDAPAAGDTVTLDYAGRFVRRKRLVSDAGISLMLDLPETVSLDDGDMLVRGDGGRVRVRAAPEALIELRAGGAVLARLAWHIGNRHTPAQIEADRILIQEDRVMAAMLGKLGAETRTVREPFRPEGGAYGTGRTLGHHHGPSGAAADPSPAHSG